ncbi:MAG: Y-family DNA polymerase [Janthinobacterium lividum]
MRRVVSLFLPNWPIDRSRRNAIFAGSPDAAGAPVVTAIHDGNRRIAAAADPVARGLGLRPGIAIAHARAMIADLDVREADPAGDLAALERLAHWAARHFTPLVAVDPPDGLWLDVTGASHLHGGEAALLETIVARLDAGGIAARAVAADTPGCAHAVAHFGACRDRRTGRVAGIAPLDPLPVAALRLDGDVVETLRRLGIDRIGQLRTLPRAPLVRRLGRGVMLRLDAALGHVAEPIDWLAAPVTLRADCRLLEPLTTAGALQTMIDRLCRDLCAAAMAGGTGVRVADLRCTRVDGDVVAVRAGTSRPTRDAAHLAALFGRRIDTIDPGFGIEAASLAAVVTEPLPAEQLRGALGETPPPDLSTLIDRLASRLGRRRVYRIGPHESDLPERSTKRIAPLATGTRGWPAWPRPTRLFDPPEYVMATAALPDHPPVRFRWRGDWHRITAADGPERVFGEWWLRDDERSSVRDYFHVEDDTGVRFWLFRAGDGVDPGTGSMDWFLQGLW